MKAFLLDKPGAPESLRLGDAPLPQPGAGQVRVKVEAVGLNPVDYKLIERGHALWSYPFIPGVDAAGIVDAVGAGVSKWKTGDRVYYHGDLRRPGAFAEFGLADAHAIAAIPANVTKEQAAALPTAGFTAWQCVYGRARLDAGMTILVHGGSGGVGGFGVQMARRLGLTVFSTASPQNAARVTALGAAHVIDYKSDVAARVRELTNGRGVDAVIDTVGPDSATQSLRLLAFGGHVMCVLGLPDFSAWQPFTKAISVHEIALGAAYASGDPAAIAKLAQAGEEVATLVAHGHIDPLVGLVVPFAELPQALSKLHRREVPAGKVVVRVD